MTSTALFTILFLFFSSISLAGLQIEEVRPGEDIENYLLRVHGKKDPQIFKQILGSASDFKNGDESIGVSAKDEQSRLKARKLLSHTRIETLVDGNYLDSDEQEKLIRESMDPAIYEKLKKKTIGELKKIILSSPESEIKALMPGLHSDVVAAVVKLMTNEELITVGQKVFNPLPNSSIGKKGYLSARVQPNSPTDHPDDIRWQVFNAWSFGVGDLMLGSNPASSTLENVHRTQKVLKEIVQTFGLNDFLPWTVLSHIDIQSAIEKSEPGSTALWFQSVAGNDETNRVFGTSARQLMDYASSRKNQAYGLYLEAGQGSEVTNGKSSGIDMGTLESRKYGLARALRKAQGGEQSWMVVNDVAGFIGPEVFKTKEQLVRVALEDTIMGKLQGLTMGLDVCSTFHMPITPDDLKWALDRIVPANPAFLMALPTQNDPMLSYNTTSFQDHLRLRNKFKFKIDERMMSFFVRLGIYDSHGQPTSHFGDPTWVYYQFLKAKGDPRTFSEIKIEARKEIREAQKRGVLLSIGHGKNVWDFNPALDKTLRELDATARASLMAPLSKEFISKRFPRSTQLQTLTSDRDEYLSRPTTGESLIDTSMQQLKKMNAADSDVVIVISDGLNSHSLMDRGHLAPYLDELKNQLKKQGLKMYPQPILVHQGRVRVGYRIGEELFSDLEDNSKVRTVIHIIGERPGNGHNTFSAYISTATVKEWKKRDQDHDRTDLISGISNTSLKPRQAAIDTLEKIRARLNSMNLSCVSAFKDK